MKPSEPLDQPLREEVKKKKSDAIQNALFIGFLIGIVIYGVAANGWGFFMLVPLFIAYKLISKGKTDEQSGNSEQC